MMNIQTAVSKERLGVNFKDGICSVLCLKATGIFVILLSQAFKVTVLDKVPNNHFLQSV